MVEVEYNIQTTNYQTVYTNLSRLGNQIFKLLPMREENKDWIKPLETLVLELLGMNYIFHEQEDYLALCCKLQGVLTKSDDIDFELFRRTIFECCGLVDELKAIAQQMGGGESHV